MSDTLNKFFSQQSDDDQKNMQLSFDMSSDVESGKMIEIAGGYRMRITSKCFKTKKDKVVQFPDLSISEEKKALMLYVVGEVVDDTAAPVVNKGDYRGFNICLAPGPGSDRHKYETIMKMCKPRIAALLGRESTKDISFDQKFIGDNLVSHFKEEEDGTFTEVTKHKMNEIVFVTFEDGYYKNRAVLDFKSVYTATDKMHSYTKGQDSSSPEMDVKKPSFGEDDKSDAKAASVPVDGKPTTNDYDEVPF